MSKVNVKFVEDTVFIWRNSISFNIFDIVATFITIIGRAEYR